MARYISNLSGTDQPNTIFVAVAINQTINEGDVLQIDPATGRAQAAVAASVSLVGVAQKSITTGGTVTSKDVIPVISFDDALFRMPYSGGPPTQASAFTHLYDLLNKTTINLADEVGGMFRVKDFNTTAGTVDVYTSASVIQ